MNSAAGIILATGALTLANEALEAPYSQGNTPVLQYINWKVIPATGVAALIFTGISEVNPKLAKALAGLAFFSALMLRPKGGNAPSPIEHIAEIFGYTTGGGKADTTPVQPPFPVY